MPTDAAEAHSYEPTTDDPLEAVVFRKVALRLIPFLFLLYVVNILDRVNVGFARLSMLDDLGLSEGVFSFGAGVFYIGYMLFEVPSNLILHRMGARRWISRIMVSWGIVSACMLFVRGDVELLPAARPAGGGRGGLLPRHHPLHQLLVPRARAGPGGGVLHDGVADRRDRRRPGLGGLAAIHERPRRPGGLAVALPRRRAFPRWSWGSSPGST